MSRTAQMMSQAAAFGLAVGLMPAAPALAADVDGNYSVRGVGSQSCSDFIAAVQEDRANAQPYVGWLGGYVTGLNRQLEDTFDLSYVLNTEHLGELVARLCAQEPEMLFETAAARIGNFMHEHRVRQASEIIQVSMDDQQVTLREDVLERFIARLADLGYLDSADTEFDETVGTAIASFQTDNELTETGLPDVFTLVTAFDSADD